MITKIFHYTTVEKAKTIKQEGFIKPIRPFLPANIIANPCGTNLSLKQFGFPKDAHAPALWGMPPERFKDKIYLEFIRAVTGQGSDIVCFEIDLKPGDKAFVFDEPVFPEKERLKEFFKASVHHTDVLIGSCRKYWESLTPRETYKEGTYRQAEVVLFHEIPVKQVSKIWDGGYVFD
jgi:hypothetical protein